MRVTFQRAKPFGGVDTVPAERYTSAMNAEIRGMLTAARDQLLASKVAADSREARLEAEVLLCHALNVDRAALYTGVRLPIGSPVAAAFHSLVARRRAGEPVAYITGTRDFYGLSFRVGPGVLIPRPETELLVERALAAAGGMSRPIIADVGCGSGCVGIALAVHLPAATVWAIDVSTTALAMTRENAAILGVDGRMTTVQGDLLTSLPSAVDVIVANLPYVNSADLATLPASIVNFEPILALDGGPAGLDQIGRLVDQAPTYLRPGGSLLLEVGYDQGEAVAELAGRRFTRACVETWRDLGGHVRVVGVRLASSATAGLPGGD